MTTSDIFKALISVGTTLHDGFVKAKGGAGGLTVGTFLKNLDLKSLGSEVTDLLKLVSAQNSTAAIAEIDAKQTALLGGRSVAQLSVDDLVRYSALSRARLLFTTQRLEDALKPNFLEWLVDEALPVLVQLAPTVLPLLL